MKYRQLLAATLTAVSMSAAAQMLPYQNPELSPAERAADLCSRLTLDEKVQLTLSSSPAIDRLGIPSYDWWSEALHGIGRNGIATVFPSCIGMAASFDDDLIERVFSAVSDEGRAKNTKARHDGTVGHYRGITFWTPNINVFRDPRWGRGQETYGEDPYMNGRMGARVVRGLQGDGTSRYYKSLACAKHYAVHSGPERVRHSFDISDLPERDLWETYLPAFRTLVQDADVRQVMCAYQRFEGKACCGSDRLLQQILRDRWGFDGVVVSDCGAINDFYEPGRHGVAADAPSAAALGVRSGTDVECGSVYRSLAESVRKGLIDEADIDRSVCRMLEGRFSVGDMDADSLVEWRSIPQSVIACDAHKKLALQMAREQMVLLKNNGVLPLAKDSRGLMLMGPNAADSTMQWGIYYGQPSHTVTALEGIRAKVGDVPYLRGCGITSMQVEESVFDRLHDASGRPGMKACYWNNTNLEGPVAAEASYTSALTLSTGGNTVFAPGVNLNNFSVRMQGTLVADRDEDIEFIVRNDDRLRLIVDGDTLLNGWNSERHRHALRKSLTRGKSCDVVLEYMQYAEDALLNFDVVRRRDMSADEVVDAAGDAEVVVFVGGISPEYEREEAYVQEPGFDNGDRTSIELPEVQRNLLKALHEAGKRIVYVNCSGSAVALTPEAAICDAIVQDWYPGEQGGHALADVLFGDFNPQGKLPVTFYRDDSQLPDFEDYRMEGRTYRYMRTTPLYPFGHGLSYTTYSYGKPAYADGRVSVEVSNTGAMAGTEVVQVYIRRPDDKSGPEKTLRGYATVSLEPGESRIVNIDMPRESFEVWDTENSRMDVLPGKYELMVGPSSREGDLRVIDVVL